MKRSRPLNLAGQSPAEDTLHLSVAQFLEWVLIPPAFFTTFPAGYGKLSKAMSGKLKAKGMKPGMPDIFVFDEKSHLVGLELKAYGRTASADQRTMHAQLMAVGIRTYICRSLDDVALALKTEGIKFKSSSFKPKETPHVNPQTHPSLFEFSPYR